MMQVKKKGIKRHILTDSQGNLLQVAITTADVQDRDALSISLHKALENNWLERCPTVIADGGYQGVRQEQVVAEVGCNLKIVKRSERKKFVVQPVRWVVERTFAWISFYRRTSKHYEFYEFNAAGWCLLSMIRRTLGKVAPKQY